MAFLCCLSANTPAQGVVTTELASIREQAALIEEQLVQYKATLALLVPQDSEPGSSDNPAVHKLVAETDSLSEELARLKHREAELLQANDARVGLLAGTITEDLTPESKPIRLHERSFDTKQEARNVERLQQLIIDYNTQMSEPTTAELSPEEASRLSALERDSVSLSRIPFSADKVRLSASEGLTVIERIDGRLNDDTLPGNRRDFALICNVRTRQHDELVETAARSLRPVGKHHYVARWTLQAGDTRFTVIENQWSIRLPEVLGGQDYLVTLYAPPMVKPEMHVIPLEALVAEARENLPDWLTTQPGLALDQR